MYAKQSDDNVTLLASTAQTTTSTGKDAVRLPGMVHAIVFTLDVTAAATDVGDLLDVFVQTRLDDTNWTDVVAFTQVLGNGGAKRYIAKVTASPAFADFEVGSALAASNARDLIGDDWRVRFAVTDAGDDNASFTFSVTGCPM